LNTVLNLACRGIGRFIASIVGIFIERRRLRDSGI
jgi:hypothetical protein